MRAPTSIAALALAVLLLSGCLPQQSAVTPTPEPTSTPVFASEEEALAAATAAYAAYLAVSDQIGADGGANPERLKPLVTAEWLAKEVGAFKEFSSTGWRQSGLTTLRSSALQQFSDDSVTLYVCTDANETRFYDSSGADVTPAVRQTESSLEVSFAIGASADGRLLLEGNDPWAAESFC